jgi:hypothetical protein
MDKLRRAGCVFLLRLIIKHVLAGAARVLRALADELEHWRPEGHPLTPVSGIKAELVRRRLDFNYKPWIVVLRGVDPPTDRMRPH